MTDSNDATVSVDAVRQAQAAWGAAVVAQDVDALAALYDFDVLLFKPTMAAQIRVDEAGARSYFVGGDPRYPGDDGFLKHGFVAVEFASARGIMLEGGAHSAQDMGHYFFHEADGGVIKADYSFSYHQRDGRVRITLHHSSFNVGAASS
jgi:hypothetical protein